MSWPCSGGEIVTERNNKKENVRDREDRSREREKNKLESEMLVARLIFRLSVLFQTHQTYHEQIWKTICLHKPSASNLSKNFCYVEYLHAAAFFVKYSTIFQSLCANLFSVQIWLQIAPDQWPRRGHSSRSPAALELHSFERDKVLTLCITILMSDQTLPRGPKWVKNEVFNFRRTVARWY